MAQGNPVSTTIFSMVLDSVLWHYIFGVGVGGGWPRGIWTSHAMSGIIILFCLRPSHVHAMGKTSMGVWRPDEYPWLGCSADKCWKYSSHGLPALPRHWGTFSGVVRMLYYGGVCYTPGPILPKGLLSQVYGGPCGGITCGIVASYNKALERGVLPPPPLPA